MYINFNEDRYTYQGCAVAGTALAGTTTNVDYKITRSGLWLSGGSLIYHTATLGDYVSFEVVDKDNVFGFGANFVLNTFIAKRYINPTENAFTVGAGYAAELPNNVYLRLKYTSCGTSDVACYMNFDLHHL